MLYLIITPYTSILLQINALCTEITINVMKYSKFSYVSMIHYGILPKSSLYPNLFFFYSQNPFMSVRVAGAAVSCCTSWSVTTSNISLG